MTFIHFCIYLIYQTHNFLQIMFSQILNFSPTILNVKYIIQYCIPPLLSPVYCFFNAQESLIFCIVNIVIKSPHLTLFVSNYSCQQTLKIFLSHLDSVDLRIESINRCFFVSLFVFTLLKCLNNLI